MWRREASQRAFLQIISRRSDLIQYKRGMERGFIIAVDFGSVLGFTSLCLSIIKLTCPGISVMTVLRLCVI